MPDSYQMSPSEAMADCAAAFREFGIVMGKAVDEALVLIGLATTEEVERAVRSIGEERARYPLDLACEIEHQRLPWWRRWFPCPIAIRT